MTVGELRAALDGAPDEMEVGVGYEGTWSAYGVEAKIESIVVGPQAAPRREAWFIIRSYS